MKLNNYQQFSGIEKIDKQYYYNSTQGELRCSIEEIGGFLKYKCKDESNNTFFKCSHTDQFYNFTHIDPNRFYFDGFDPLFTLRCDNDTKFYQACGTGAMSTKPDPSTFCGRTICRYENRKRCTEHKYIGRRILQNTKSSLLSIIGEDNFKVCDVQDVPEIETNKTEDEYRSVEEQVKHTCRKLQFTDIDACMEEAVFKNSTFGFYCDKNGSLRSFIPKIYSFLASLEQTNQSGNASIDEPNKNSSALSKYPKFNNFLERKLGLNNSRTFQLKEFNKNLSSLTERMRGSSFSRKRNFEQTIDKCNIREQICIPLGRKLARSEVEIFNFTRCNPFGMAICKNGIDQVNCTDHPDQIGLWCKIDGKWTTIAKMRVCLKSFLTNIDPGPLCDDKLDIACPACGVHKHKICDGVQDCRDKSDEIGCDLMPMAEKKCKRTGGNGTELSIPLEWLLDGQKDCMDGIDENKENIRICGEGRLRRLTFNSHCENVFICRSGDHGYIQLDKLCDGTDSCDDERKICAVSRDLPDLPVKILEPSQELKKHMSYCLPGLEELQNQANGALCQKESFIYPDHNYFGVDDKAEMKLPSETQDLKHLFGEHYVYNSCRGNTTESCPLTNIPYDSCPGQYRNRIGTFASSTNTSRESYLTFFEKSFKGFYRNDFFVCDNGEKCIDYSQVCDLINDCGDGSDEVRCKNHFSCPQNSTQKIYIPWTSYCDGKFDCPDLSDECNTNCSKQILDSTELKVATITIGTIAVVANSVVILNSFLSLSKCKTPIALANKSLVLLIGAGDFLIGGYLLLLTAADIFFSTLEDGHTGYCRNQIRWLVSYKCDILGVFSTVGSQISLFAMTVLSVLRLFGVLNSDRIQHRITRRSRMSVGACVFLIILSSFVVAIVPIIPMVEFVDFFVSGLAFQKELKLFVGIKTREELFAVIQEYFGRTRASRENDKQWSWRTMENLVRSMFSGGFDRETNGATNIDISRLGFYGNDGVCLFKFFVTPEDPQRHFVWSILMINFLCFFTISVCYITSTVVIRMTAFAAKTMKERHGSTLSNIERSHIKRQKSLQQKIAFIIFTDFICWIPFIIVCALHFFKIIAANEWYAFFSVIVLPINSIINPFLYDEVFTNALSMLWKRLRMHGVTCSKLIEERRTVSSSGNSSAGSVAAGPSSGPIAETPT